MSPPLLLRQENCFNTVCNPCRKNISQQVFLSTKQVLLLSPPHITLTATPANCLVHEFSSPLLPALNCEEEIKIIKGPFPWLFFFKGPGAFWRKGNKLKLWYNYYANQYLPSWKCSTPSSSDKSNLQPGRKLKGTDHWDFDLAWSWEDSWKYGQDLKGSLQLLLGWTPLNTCHINVWPESHILRCLMSLELSSSGCKRRRPLDT